MPTRLQAEETVQENRTARDSAAQVDRAAIALAQIADALVRIHAELSEIDGKIHVLIRKKKK